MPQHTYYDRHTQGPFPSQLYAIGFRPSHVMRYVSQVTPDGPCTYKLF